jgi:mannose-1-phosphate guanylyltransferase
MTAVPGFWAVIPAGGAGTRLWPLSRAASPKFLHDLTGTGSSLLQATVRRVSPLADGRVLVVTGAAHADAVRSQLPDLPPDRVIAEPSPRDSMAAIGLAVALVEHDDPDAVVGSFAADHVIPDEGPFGEAVREAVEVAAGGDLATIGIAPTSPATGFGYIRMGDPISGFATARRVGRFVEKPDIATATAYLESGEYRWNAGMFVCRAGVLLDLLGTWHPELAAGLRQIAADPARLPELWPGLGRISIDHAVAEPAADAGRVAVVPGGFGWDDLGDFASLWTHVPRPDRGPAVLGDPDLVVALDSTGLVVPAGGRAIAVVGLDDVIVVDTGDAVLVTTRDRAQEVKAVVDALKARGRTDLV